MLLIPKNVLVKNEHENMCVLSMILFKFYCQRWHLDKNVLGEYMYHIMSL